MNSLISFVKQHPLAIFAVVGFVILLAYIRRQQAGGTGATSADGTGVQFGGGGEVAPTIDPSVAGIMEADVAARSSDFSTLAGTVLGSQQSTDTLAGTEATSYAQLTQGLADTGANLEASLAQIQAEAETARLNSNNSLAATEATLQEELAAAEATATQPATVSPNTSQANGLSRLLASLIAGNNSLILARNAQAATVNPPTSSYGSSENPYLGALSGLFSWIPGF